METEELLRYERVTAFIDREIARMKKLVGESGATVRERNRAFMEENPYGSVYGEGDALIRENERTLAEAGRMRAEIALLERIREAPYFGRVDFTYEEDGDEEQIYIGIKTLVDAREFLVYDWRAPISSLFYLGELGKAAYTAPAGEIRGEITRIRQYEFSRGSPPHWWDAELRVDDAVLRSVLSGRSSEQMKPIVYTIQREQNAAIRYAPGRNLAVFGPAGCGKTSVGMHRLAWLMYQAHMSGAPVSTLMCTANEAFRSYVTAVLPALGEENTAMVSFTELFERFLPEFTVQSALRQTEALIAGEPARRENVDLLYGEAFLEYVRESLRALPVRFRTIRILEKEALSAAAIEHRFRALPVNVPVRARLETTAAWVEDELTNYFLIHRKEMLEILLDRTELGESYTRRYFVLKKRVLQDSRAMVLAAVPTEPAALLRRLFAGFYGAGKALSALSARIEARSLWFEDAAVMLYLAAALGRCAVPETPTHVLVDEAQDLAPVLHRILRALYPKAVFTVLADPNQGISPAANTCGEETLAALYGADVLRLGRSYRSTKEIGGFAKRYLPETAAGYEIFNRSGPAPVEKTVPDSAAAAAEVLLAAKGQEKTVCVLLRTAAEARAFYKRLAPLAPGLALLAEENRAVNSKLLCMPAALAKGLEFDCVVLPLLPGAKPENRLMYLMCTRALHELYLFTETEGSAR